ncbi:cytochrome P450 [Athelia psychrophila]|uniref:Cytochrome P450 n=1 Tax=Athelia psychrophila TaxID=1759441 RepID=A0A166P7A9_9AGAM|nr:cytochrome P450 [Fibularhizoctonia sp. CBS 109695]
MAPTIHPIFVNLAVFLGAIWAISQVFKSARRRSKTTPLGGPTRPSFFFGVSKYLAASKDGSLILEKWAEEHGPTFYIPTALGSSELVITDPKAISHIYSNDTYGYIQTGFMRLFFEMLVGKGVIWAEHDNHKRQRKMLTPAFSNSAIRNLSPLFTDSAYKIRDAWDGLLEQSGEAVIDVQAWMNKVSLDSVGIAGFSHDFGTLEGKQSDIADIFDDFGRHKPSFVQMLVFVLSAVFPVVGRLPTARNRLIQGFAQTTQRVSRSLLEKTRKDNSVAVGSKGDKSVIGILIKASDESSELNISDEEAIAQVKVLILAGYETTSISLTWTLLELAKKQGLQQKLRNELLTVFGGGGDPTYDQLNSANSLPYLDAVVHETLRLHAPLWFTTRVSTVDDIIPLSAPIKTINGQTVDRISIAAGQAVQVPIRMINRSDNIWGVDAKEYKPERWLDEAGLPAKAQEIQGHRHLLTFADGPRACLGKSFALTEFKAVLSVLIRNYTFELPDGPDTEFDLGRGILPRPKVAGEEGCRLPLRVRRVE